MQRPKNRVFAILLSLILVISIGTSTILIQNVSAHTPAWQITTYAWVTAAPNPVGVGQQIYIYGWLDLVINGALLNNGIRFNNYQFTITKPDGTTVTQSFPIVADTTSSQGFPYVPDQIGTYTVFFSYPGQVYNYGGAYQGDYYTPSNATAKFTVQSTPATGFTEFPLPTDYWTRPINGQNINWDSIGSNWLGGAATGNYWQQNGAAPLTAHIMWTKPLEFGGLTGGIVTQTGNTAQTNDTYATYYSGFSYNTRFGSPLIVSGVLYYQQPLGEAGSGGGEFAVDLRTGQTLWSSTTFTPSKAQLYDLQSPDQHGVVGGILWQTVGSTWIGCNAFNGQFLFNLTNVPSGTEVYLNNGEIDRYVLSYNQAKGTGWLALWNETAVMVNAQLLYNTPEGWPTGPNLVIDANTPVAYSWNVTINTNINGTAAPSIAGVIPGKVILGTSSSVGLTSTPNPNTNPWTMWAISDKPETRGNVTWIQRYPAPPGNLTQMLATQPIDPVTNEWTMTYFETGQRLAYNLDSGNLVWGPSPIAQTGFQYYSAREGVPAYGNLYVSGYGGIVYCYSMLNGTLLWTYGNGGAGNSTNTGLNTPWGLYPTHIAAFAGGVLYLMSGEHSPNTPLYRGELARAVNASTGQELWTLPDWSASGLGTSMAPVAIADGYMAFANAYDGQVYVVGRGPSATTVSVQNNVISQGNSVLIQGTVMDTAAGTKQNRQAAVFPNGVPAVSDDSMSSWMSYVYQQEARPSNATGVTVSLIAIDPNGNVINIGDATSDANGMFSKLYTPDVPGQYTIYASFSGTNSYWPSSSETFIAVTQPATATSTTTALPIESNTNTYILGAAIAIIIAIAIVGAVLVLLVRKRP